MIVDGVNPDALLWADLGAGDGTFSLALSEIIGFGGIIFSVDQKLDLLKKKLRNRYYKSQIHLYSSNILKPMPFLPELDGILLANVLHYVEDQQNFITHLEKYLKKNGVIIIVEYDREDSNPWVPYPLSLVSLQRLTISTEYTLPEEIGRKKSIYDDHDMYCAIIQKNEVIK